jgi:hypothetical protein
MPLHMGSLVYYLGFPPLFSYKKKINKLIVLDIFTKCLRIKYHKDFGAIDKSKFNRLKNPLKA